MSCEKYQSLPLDERTPEDRLAIELAEVPYIHMLLMNEAESKIPVQTMAQVPWVPRDRRANAGVRPYDVPV